MLFYCIFISECQVNNVSIPSSTDVCWRRYLICGCWGPCLSRRYAVTTQEHTVCRILYIYGKYNMWRDYELVSTRRGVVIWDIISIYYFFVCVSYMIWSDMSRISSSAHVFSLLSIKDRELCDRGYCGNTSLQAAWDTSIARMDRFGIHLSTQTDVYVLIEY